MPTDEQLAASKNYELAKYSVIGGLQEYFDAVPATARIATPTLQFCGYDVRVTKVVDITVACHDEDDSRFGCTDLQVEATVSEFGGSAIFTLSTIITVR